MKSVLYFYYHKVDRGADKNRQKTRHTHSQIDTEMDRAKRSAASHWW